AESQLDWEKVKAAFGEDINFANERYVLNWAGKSDAFKILQQPTTATLKPIPEESVNFDKSENLFIEGENLEVLKVLQKAYYNKVKCIIIDPPYNTGSDSFIYPDRFSEKKEDYLKRIGDKDEEGYLMKEGLFRKNSKDRGHFHSNWLSMMYPRLFLAKNLLRDDGVIFVHIDDNEVHNLRLVMNEIFGEENFFAQVIVRSNSRGQTYKQIAKTHEYLLIYTKKFESELNELEKDEANNDLNLRDSIGNFNIRELRNRNPKFGKHNRPNLYYPIYVNPTRSDNDGFYPVNLVKNNEYHVEVFPLNSEKKESCWRWGKNKCSINIEEDTLISNLIAKKKADGTFGVFEKYRKTTYKPKSIWDDNSFLTETGTIELRELGIDKVFDFPKPVSLEKQILNLSIQDDDIILDFFSGSATTAQAVLELNKEDNGNRKFILVQMPEQCYENSDAYKAGYKTIADIGKERIRRVIKKIQGNTLDGHSRETCPRGSQSGNGNPEGLFKDKELDSRLQTAGMTKEYSNDKNLDLGFKAFKLSPSNFKIWRGAEIDSEEKLTEQLDAFTNPTRPDAEKQNMLYELMLKAGYGLTSSVQHVIASGAKQSQKGKKIASGS
ncbi:MAG: site-specific DNA-methyltransferase, partial [Bacteroidetes bacterium]|nr:site-specific DNA-methyltransferase [Bacteroidota bacterium]